MTDEVHIYVHGQVGHISLNRPKAIHSLTQAMVEAMTAALLAWRDDDAIRLIIVDHAEGRGFCAGGDVRALADWIVADNLPVRLQLQLHKILWNDEPGH